MTSHDTPSPRFDDSTVRGVVSHMNADHTDDTLLICRTLGGRDRATDARMLDLDCDGGNYSVTVDGSEETIRIPWAKRLTERAEIRAEVVRMFEAACHQLGIEPRPH